MGYCKKGEKSVPTNQKLYKKIEKEVKERVEVWPSAYASGQLVAEYKRRGGKYKCVKKSSKKGGRKRSQRSQRSRRNSRKRSRKRSRQSNKRGGSLDRWFKEDWRNVCKKTPSGKYARCGRKEANMKASEYPYCRPLHRINKDTPKTIGELGKKKIDQMCKRKKRTMKKSKGRQTRVYVKNKRKPRSKRSKRSKRGGRKRTLKTRRTRRRSRRRTCKKTGGGHYKLPSLPKGTKFEKGPGRYKYTAILPDGKRVNFGHRDYQHFRDRVPKNKGGKLWSHKDHNDKERMENYRARHRGILSKSGTPAYKKKYSPSWFSYHFLW